MIQTIKTLAAENKAALIAIRRHLHQHPELSYEETETGKYIANALKQMQIPYTHGVAGNGVVAMIHGKDPDAKIVALRGDIDALPIQEANDVPYASVNAGVMHACGHDVHTTCLLGAAEILSAIRNQFSGTVKLIFQPAEERLPGGASLMIAEGVLENPSPATIFGQHVHPPLEVGKVGLCPGPYMASADELYLTVKGRGGHGALPQECIDPVTITAQILTALQQIVSRQSHPTTPSVLTFGKIESLGGATNVIPNEVYLEGTFRTMDEEWRKQAHISMVKIARGIAEGMGGSCDFEVKKGYPVLVNDVQLTQTAKKAAIAYLGAENVIDLPIRMTAEDFAYYSHHLPACFYRLGTGNPEKGIISPIHTNTFDVDEDCLEIGAGLMAWQAVCNLGA